MSLIYRNAGAWGAGKGAPLTSTEADNNIYQLSQDVTAAANAAAAGVISVVDLVQSGTAVYFKLSDNSLIGPVDLSILRPTTELDVEVVTDSTFTLGLEQAGGIYLIEAACEITLPNNNTAAIPIGSRTYFRCETDADVTFIGELGSDSTVDVKPPRGHILPKMPYRGAVWVALKTGADAWDLYGPAHDVPPVRTATLNSDGTWTPELGDEQTWWIFTTDCIVSLPSGVFAVGDEIHLDAAAGVLVSVDEGSGVTIRKQDDQTASLRPGGTATLKFTASNVAKLFGALEVISS